MSRKRDTNWARDEITVLLDGITDITRKRAQDGRKTNSREIFEYAARKLGEKGHTARAEREKCRAKWKKMKEEYTHAKRAREGDTNFKEAPGILPFYDRMEMLINGPFDNISPHSTIVRRTNSMSNSSSTSNTSSVSNNNNTNNTKTTSNSSATPATRTPATSSTITPTPTMTGENFSAHNNENGNNNNDTHNNSSNDNTNQMDHSNSNVVVTSLCSSTGRHSSGLRASARIAAITTPTAATTNSISNSTSASTTQSNQSDTIGNQLAPVTANGLDDNEANTNSATSSNSNNDFTRTPTSSSSLSFDNNNPNIRNESTNNNNSTIESSPSGTNLIVLSNIQRSTLTTSQQQSNRHLEQNKTNMANNNDSNLTHQPLLGINNIIRSSSSTSSSTSTSTSTASANTTSVQNNPASMINNNHHNHQQQSSITQQQPHNQHHHPNKLNPGGPDYCAAYNNTNQTSSSLAVNLCPISRPKEADVSYRVSAGCRQITIFGDQDIDIKFRGDCVTINKIELDYTGSDGS